MAARGRGSPPRSTRVTRIPQRAGEVANPAGAIAAKQRPPDSPPPPRGQGAGKLADAKPAAGSIDVGSTENKPELLKTIPIGTVAGKGREVVLSLGADSDTDSPLPDLAADDRLLALAELELTTDADDPHHPGRIGNAYSYAPNVEATDAARRRPGRDAGKARQGDRAGPQAVERSDHPPAPPRGGDLRRR